MRDDRKYEIPPRSEIEEYYDDDELEQLDRLRGPLSNIPDIPKRCRMGRAALRTMWPDELTFIAKTHWIETKVGELQLLVPNYAQRRFYDDVIQRCRVENRPIRGIILKARQLGFSTFIQSWQYEQCDNNDYRSSLTLSYDEPSTEDLFSKARVIHDKMWFPRATKRASGKRLEFSENGSKFLVRTSGNLSAGRGSTYQHVHCSEEPMWLNSQETLTALNQSIPSTAESSQFRESTAKGATGTFFEAWRSAEDNESDLVPFFAPWFWDDEYRMDLGGKDAQRAFLRSLSPQDKDHQARFDLTAEQMAWRHWKIRNDLNGSRKRFQQEYPASAEEAFITTGSPVFNPETVARLEANAVSPMWVGDIILPKN